jgi:hypothetical protein
MKHALIFQALSKHGSGPSFPGSRTVTAGYASAKGTVADLDAANWDAVWHCPSCKRSTRNHWQMM